MLIPADLRYSSDHEWVRHVRADPPVVRMGITDYAQDALGDVVFVELPAVGSAVGAGQSMGEVESTKSVSDVYAPVSGQIVAINEALDAAPGRLNDDPYGEGWLCELAVSDAALLDELLDATAYRELTGS